MITDQTLFLINMKSMSSHIICYLTRKLSTHARCKNDEKIHEHTVNKYSDRFEKKLSALYDSFSLLIC